MIEITDQPKKVLGIAMGRSLETQEAYEAHAQRKLESGDCSCDMCRLAKEQKVKIGTGALDMVTKELEILERELERVEDDVSLVINEFGYKFYDGQIVKDDGHLMLLPTEHVSRMSDFSERTRKAYHHILPLLMDCVDATHTRSPSSTASSQRGHLHTHAFIFDGMVEELHYTEDEGTRVRRRGSAVLELL